MDKVKIYLSQWNVMRVLRLVMGILIIIQGVKAGMWLIAGLGVLFTILPLMNIGGCSVNGSCQVPPRERR